ncbi:MAG: formate dehydrogenase accessory sulfurtransferase FdhD [Candidatus Bathyarchaeia archaeon]
MVRLILRFNGLRGDFESLRDVVAVEDAVNLYVNGRLYTTFHCTPSHIKELIVGRLLTDGVIGEVKDILEMNFSGKNIYVKLPEEKAHNALRGTALIAALSEGFIPPDASINLQRQKPDNIEFCAETIFKAVEALNARSLVFNVSGGTHAAALMDEHGGLIAFAEDVGRHNAVDKVVGDAALKGAVFSRLLLASTGRLTSEIVIKAALIGVPAVVSLSAPTSMGIKVAEVFNMTLIGFARGRRFNIYASPERIRR